MNETHNSDNGPEIKEVLKALNHGKRRDNLLYIKDLGRSCGFSELMDYLNEDSKSSGQFSYHIKLLVSAGLLLKQDERYQISSLGLKASSILDMVDTSEKTDTIVQKITQSFKNISTFDQVIISFEVFSFILFLIPFVEFLRNISHVQNLSLILIFQLIFGIITFSGLTMYSYRKLKYIPSLLVLTSMVYIIFLPYNQTKIGIIYIGSNLGLILLFQGFLLFKSNIVLIGNTIFAILCLVVSGSIALKILYNEYIKKEHIS